MSDYVPVCVCLGSGKIKQFWIGRQIKKFQCLFCGGNGRKSSNLKFPIYSEEGQELFKDHLDK